MLEVQSILDNSLNSYRRFNLWLWSTYKHSTLLLNYWILLNVYNNSRAKSIHANITPTWRTCASYKYKLTHRSLLLSYHSLICEHKWYYSCYKLRSLLTPANLITIRDVKYKVTITYGKNTIRWRFIDNLVKFILDGYCIIYFYLWLQQFTLQYIFHFHTVPDLYTEQYYSTLKIVYT